MPESSWNARQAATRDRCLCRCPLTHRNGTRMTPSVVFLNPQLAPLDATRSPRRAPSPLSIYSPPPTRLPVGVRVAIRAEQITQAECHRARRAPRTRVARIAPRQESRRPACAPAAAAAAATASACVPFKSSLLYNIASLLVLLAFSLDCVVCLFVRVYQCACACACVSLSSANLIRDFLIFRTLIPTNSSTS